ncbi:MAG: 30S ribosomal protein S17 [Egibacteraceae bacterium]
MSMSANPQTDQPRGERKVRQGVVTSDRMDKTVVVLVERRTTHPLYRKIVTRSEKLHAHDEHNDVHVGDRVRVVETRPLSKTKRWRVAEVIERAK